MDSKLMKNILIISSLIFSLSVNGQKAFPTAMGGGSNVTGGRGGAVIHVTNRNDSGTGSLRAALTSTGTRTIVFDVSGNFQIDTQVNMGSSNSNVTIAGQTAPMGGVTITGNPINMTLCDNVIWRYVRFRNAKYTGDHDGLDKNGIWSNGTTDMIIDHCSFSFNDDQAISINTKNSNAENITVSRSLFGENATNIIIGYDPTYTMDKVSYIANLYSNSPHRTPNVGLSGRVDIINQVSFNFPTRATNLNVGSPQVNYIGNYLQRGSYSATEGPNKVEGATPTIYTAYNYHNTLETTPIENDYVVWSNYSGGTPLSPTRFTGTRYSLLANTPEPMTALDAYTSVMANVGANRYLDSDGSPQEYIDTYDSGRISDVTTLTSRNPFNKSWTLPTLPTNTRDGSFDTDNDGMADTWEVATFGNLSKTANGTDLHATYTNIEIYFNQVDGTTPAPTCSDGIQNGDETGIDCGGSCSPCGSGGIETSTGAGARAFMNYLLTD